MPPDASLPLPDVRVDHPVLGVPSDARVDGSLRLSSKRVVAGDETLGSGRHATRGIGLAGHAKRKETEPEEETHGSPWQTARHSGALDHVHMREPDRGAARAGLEGAVRERAGR